MHRRAVGRLSGVLAASLFALAAAPGAALAYDPNAAVAWAEAHWNTCGVSGQYQCINDDCTAFVSEAVHAGGYSLDTNGTIPKGGTSDDTQWYMLYQPKTGSYIWSNSFTFSKDYRQWLIVDYPGGYNRGYYAGTTLISDSGGGNGDVIFYDWNSDGTYTHASIIVGNGPTSDGWQGDYVDSHTNPRHDAFWTLRTWNTDIQTTTINTMYVSTANG